MKCLRCNGTGQTPYKHIADGICFACNGSGKIQYSPDKHDDLDLFIFSGRVDIGSGTPVKMVKGCNRVRKGGEFIAQCVGDCVIFWNKKAGANWHIKVPKSASDLMAKHFRRL